MPRKYALNNFRMETPLHTLFVPKGGYDPLRDTLRRVVFRADYRSATCITRIMMDKLTEYEIYALTTDWNKISVEVRQEYLDEFDETLDTRSTWLHNGWLLERSPEFAKVLGVVDKFRREHAVNLRVHDVRDVHISYVNGTLTKFMDDRDWIQSQVSSDVMSIKPVNVLMLLAQGGIVYHLWPGEKYPFNMKFDVVAKTSVIERFKRNHSKQIADKEMSVSDNTEPADEEAVEASLDTKTGSGDTSSNCEPAKVLDVPFEELTPETRAELRAKVAATIDGIISRIKPEDTLKAQLARLPPPKTPYRDDPDESHKEFFEDGCQYCGRDIHMSELDALQVSATEKVEHLTKVVEMCSAQIPYLEMRTRIQPKDLEIARELADARVAVEDAREAADVAIEEMYALGMKRAKNDGIRWHWYCPVSPGQSAGCRDAIGKFNILSHYETS